MWAAGLFLCSCYAAQNENVDAFLAELTAHIAAVGPATRWAVMGDYNLEPRENPLVAALQRYHGGVLQVCSPDGVALPTRWRGNRSIDYLIGHCACAVSRLQFGMSKYNDHKLLVGSLSASAGAEVVNWTLAPAASYHKPVGRSKDAWSLAIRDEWNKCQPLPEPGFVTQEGCDEWWKLAVDKLELAFKNARVSSCSEGSCSRRRVGRGKSQTPRVIRSCAVAKHVEGCLVANRIRCLRNLLARLLSLHDHNVADTDSCEEAGNLKRNIQRCPYLPSGLGLTAQILHVTEDIRKSEAELKQGQLDRWRDRLCGSVSACFKWVRGSSCTYTHRVCLGDETSSDSLSEAIDRLKRYWESVWNRPLPNLDDQFASCARVLGPSRETADWGPLQSSELHKAAQNQAGTSPGPDGWSGNELACIHPDVWACLVSFFNRCECVGLTPSSWKNLRQIHLPKDGKPKRESDQATPAANHRPIAVLSCFWRTWASARLKSDCVQSWTRTWVRQEAYGGRRGVGTYDAVASLL